MDKQYKFLNIILSLSICLTYAFRLFDYNCHFFFFYFFFSYSSILIFKINNSLDFLKLHQYLGSILFGIDEHKCIYITRFFFSCCFVSLLLLSFILLLAIFFSSNFLSLSFCLYVSLSVRLFLSRINREKKSKQQQQ